MSSPHITEHLRHLRLTRSCCYFHTQSPGDPTSAVAPTADHIDLLEELAAQKPPLLRNPSASSVLSFQSVEDITVAARHALGRMLIQVTEDNERFLVVDVSGLDSAAGIKERMLSKLRELMMLIVRKSWEAERDTFCLAAQIALRTIQHRSSSTGLKLECQRPADPRSPKTASGLSAKRWETTKAISSSCSSRSVLLPGPPALALLPLLPSQRCQSRKGAKVSRNLGAASPHSALR